VITGRVWKFGDNINTDLMLPGSLAYASEDAQRRAVFSANRPGWVDLVQKGDILIGGRNYGIGSSRPAARSLRNLGLGCLIAESINGLFFRNAVNFGFLALECPGIHTAFEEGQLAEVDVSDWTVTNRDTKAILKIKSIPGQLLQLVEAGGVYPNLERDGFISPYALGARQQHSK
jgi:3-isopropylmalate/(R)-2-methylmalate dehydratase small subunit